MQTCASNLFHGPNGYCRNEVVILGKDILYTVRAGIFDFIPAEAYEDGREETNDELNRVVFSVKAWNDGRCPIETIVLISFSK